MPLYEYNCTVCLASFERIRPISRMENTVPCPDCGSKSQKQLSVCASFSTNAEVNPLPVETQGGGCCGGGCGSC